MDQQIKKINYRVLLVLFLIYELVYLLFLKSNDITDYTNMLATALIFLFLFIVYLIILSRSEDKLFNRTNKICYLYLGIFLSIICVLISEVIEIYHIWMIGCMLISVSYGAYIGVISSILVLFMEGICKGYSPEEYVYYEALVIILCLLFEFIPDTKSVIKNLVSYFYFMIIALSCNISLYLITNKLNYELLFEEKFYYNAFYTIIMVTIIYILWYVFIFKTKDINSTDDDIERLLKNDFELLQRFKNENPLIFKHSLVVADISKKAAAAVGADVKLVMAGSVYHEIGRLIDKNNYLEKNIEIATEYKFGDKLTNIIMSHNIKSDKPKSKEAAIVYFTDNILNTIYYMKNVRKNTVHTNKQIIESFFNKNIKDEKLYESGLSVAEYGILRDFYINIFEKQEG